MGGRELVEQRMLLELRDACPPVLDRMTLQEAIVYSRHQIRTVIDQTGFGPDVAPVGGPIDTLVMTARGFSWVALKSI